MKHYHYLVQAYSTWDETGGNMANVTNIDVVVFEDDQPRTTQNGVRLMGDAKSIPQQVALEQAEALHDKKRSQVNGQTVYGGYRIASVVAHDDRLGLCQGPSHIEGVHDH